MKKTIMSLLFLSTLFAISAASLEELTSNALAKSLTGKSISYQIDSNILSIKELDKKGNVDLKLSGNSAVELKKNGSAISTTGFSLGIPTNKTFNNYYKPKIEGSLTVNTPYDKTLENTSYITTLGISNIFDFNNRNRDVSEYNKIKTKKQILDNNTLLLINFKKSFLINLKRVLQAKYNLEDIKKTYEDLVNKTEINQIKNDYAKESISYKNQKWELEKQRKVYDLAEKNYNNQVENFEKEYSISISGLELKAATLLNIDYKPYDSNNHDLTLAKLNLDVLENTTTTLELNSKYEGQYYNSKNTLGKNLAKMENKNSGKLSANLAHGNVSFNTEFSISKDPHLSIGFTYSPFANDKRDKIAKQKVEVDRLSTKSLMDKITYENSKTDFDKKLIDYNTELENLNFYVKITSEQFEANKKAFESGIISKDEVETVENKLRRYKEKLKLLSIDRELLILGSK